MCPDLPPEPSPDRRRHRVGGPRVVLVGALIILALSAFIVSRMLQVSGPGPDPETIPPRPGTEQAP